MKQILLLLTAVTLVACIGATDPNADRLHCLYPGDTIGLVAPLHPSDSTVIACIWALEIKTRCYVGEVTRLSQATTPCIEGEKWKG